MISTYYHISNTSILVWYYDFPRGHEWPLHLWPLPLPRLRHRANGYVQGKQTWQSLGLLQLPWIQYKQPEYRGSQLSYTAHNIYIIIYIYTQLYTVTMSKYFTARVNIQIDVNHSTSFSGPSWPPGLAEAKVTAKMQKSKLEPEKTWRLHGEHKDPTNPLWGHPLQIISNI